MRFTIRVAVAGLVAMLLVVTAAWFLNAVWRQVPASQTSSGTVTLGAPVVMRTPGGLLEVSTVTATERFTRADSRQFWGLDLGTTVSSIQARVHYRYHIELAREWPLQIRGRVCTVRAPALRPSLPVAFDSASLEKYTASGWARFNKQENLDRLEASMTTALNVRAGTPHYLQLATEAGRSTVREFVARWLLTELAGSTDPDFRIVVLFPGETPESIAMRP